MVVHLQHCPSSPPTGSPCSSVPTTHHTGSCLQPLFRMLCWLTPFFPLHEVTPSSSTGSQLYPSSLLPLLLLNHLHPSCKPCLFSSHFPKAWPKVCAQFSKTSIEKVNRPIFCRLEWYGQLFARKHRDASEPLRLRMRNSFLTLSRAKQVGRVKCLHSYQIPLSLHIVQPLIDPLVMPFQYSLQKVFSNSV